MPEHFNPDKMAEVGSLEQARARPAPRVRGYLYVTEYNNYGDVQWETAIEPPTRTQKATIGGASVPIAASTHYVTLFATYPCRVAFVPDGEDLANAESHAFPLAAETETPRLVPMNTAMAVVTFPDY